MADAQIKFVMSAESKQLTKELAQAQKELHKTAEAAKKADEKLDDLFFSSKAKKDDKISAITKEYDKQKSELEKTSLVYDGILKKLDEYADKVENIKKLYSFMQKNPDNKGLIAANAKKWGTSEEEVKRWVKLNSMKVDAGSRLRDQQENLSAIDARRKQAESEPLANAREIENATRKSTELATALAEAKEKYDSLKADLTFQQILDRQAHENKVKEAFEAQKQVELQQQIAMAEKQREVVLKRTQATMKKISQFMSNLALGAVRKSVDAMVAPFKKLSYSAKQFGRRLRYAVMQGLLLRPLRNILSKITEGFVRALRKNAEFEASLSNLKGTVLTGLASAFNALLPIITSIVNWIAKLLTYLFSFINVLFKLGGASKKAGKEFGSAMEEAGGGSDKDKKNFASWDTVQQLQTKDNSGGGSGSGASAISPTFEQDFSKAEEYLARLKEKILADDWYGVGMELAKILNDITATVDNWLVNKFIPKMHEVGKNAGDLFNGMWDGIDPKLGGATLAHALNGVVDSIATFFETANFETVGVKLGTNLNTFFADFDTKRLGEGVNEMVTDIVTLIAGLIETANPAEIGDALVRLFDGLNLFGSGGGLFGSGGLKLFGSVGGDTGLFGTAGKIIFGNLGTGGLLDTIFTKEFESLSKLSGNLVGAISGFAKSIWEEIKKAFNSIFKGEGKDGMKSSGKDLIDGLFDGIKEKIQNIRDWLDEHIVQPFLKGFQQLFRIGSPSKVMEEQGGYVVDGFLLAFDGLSEKVSEIFEGVKNAIKVPINGIIGFINKLITGVVNGINKMISSLNALKINIPDWIPAIGGKNFNLNISPISATQIPYLAQGTVVNPNHEFAAILGDNKREQEIVSPLSTMKQALREALIESGMNNRGGKIVLEMDGREFAHIATPYLQNEKTRIGIKSTGGAY